MKGRVTTGRQVMVDVLRVDPAKAGHQPALLATPEVGGFEGRYALEVGRSGREQGQIPAGLGRPAGHRGPTRRPGPASSIDSYWGRPGKATSTSGSAQHIPTQLVISSETSSPRSAIRLARRSYTAWAPASIPASAHPDNDPGPVTFGQLPELFRRLGLQSRKINHAHHSLPDQLIGDPLDVGGRGPDHRPAIDVEVGREVAATVTLEAHHADLAVGRGDTLLDPQLVL